MLNVAVIGSGPAGLYAAEALVKQAAALPAPVPVRVDVIDRLPQLGQRAAYLKQEMEDMLIRHRAYIREEGIDIPEVLNWTWDASSHGNT